MAKTNRFPSDMVESQVVSQFWYLRDGYRTSSKSNYEQVHRSHLKAIIDSRRLNGGAVVCVHCPKSTVQNFHRAEQSFCL